MVAVREKTHTTMRLSGACPTHARTEVSVGKHRLTIDEPAARGGTDLGATPTETMLSSLIGCTNVILSRIAHARGVKLDGLQVDAEAQFDRRGAMMQEDVAVPFPEIKLNIAFASDAAPAQIDELKRDLGRFCPVAKVFREAGTRIDETWTVRKA